jgi:pSer/pThr/pTyr-binding forkhead associated (FHA) protein
MPYLQLADAQFPLFVGETHVGRGTGSDIRLPGTEDEATAVAAVITVADDHTASVARAGDGISVSLNGAELGEGAAPLAHGDRLTVDGVELRYEDEVQRAITEPVPSMSRELATQLAARGPAARTGGRLISLKDGREYRVRGTGLTIGREAGCDVVVAATPVSRRHARIDDTADGYVLVDSSTNGVLVNGTRVRDRQPLSGGDVIRIGPEDFRFEADPVSGSFAAPSAPPVTPSVMPPALPPSAPLGFQPGATAPTAPPVAPAESKGVRGLVEREEPASRPAGSAPSRAETATLPGEPERLGVPRVLLVALVAIAALIVVLMLRGR